MTEAGVPPESRVYSLEEIAAMLAARGRPLSIQALRDRCRDGRLGAAKRARGWRVAQADLDRFLAGDSPASGPAPDSEPAAPAASERAGRARRALAELKLKLEEERRRRRARLAAEEAAGRDEVCEEPTDADDAARKGPRPAPPAIESASEVVGAVEVEEDEAGRPDLDATGRAAAGDEEALSGAKAAGAEPSPAAGQLDPDRSFDPVAGGEMPDDSAAADTDAFLAELEADERLAADEVPDEATEEGELEGRDLRFSCELDRDEEGELRRHGIFESWYANGRQAARGSYERGLLEGPWQQWHDNGRLLCVGAHRDGLPDGPWTWWDEDGRKTQEVHYDRGRPDGLWSQFHHNGRTWCEGRYRAGIAIGNFRYWDGEGRPA